MSVPRQIVAASGTWKGRSKLHLSWLPEDQRISDSDSELQVQIDFQVTYATLSYSWIYQGNRQEGTMLIAGKPDAGEVQIAWCDSWHQDSAVLHLYGEPTETGIKTKGTYAGEGEIWGWTITLNLTGDVLYLEMENVTPNGEAEWAVRGEYLRSS